MVREPEGAIGIHGSMMNFESLKSSLLSTVIHCPKYIQQLFKQLLF
jgi:hypothetical protein